MSYDPTCHYFENGICKVREKNNERDIMCDVISFEDCITYKVENETRMMDEVGKRDLDITKIGDLEC